MLKYPIRCFFRLLLLICVAAPCKAQSLTGIWENTERFIEYTPKADSASADTLHIVLKTYYRYVYEDMGEYPVTCAPDEQSEGLYQLAVRYPQGKKAAETSLWVYRDSLFSSFYKKIPYTIGNSNGPAARPLSVEAEPTSADGGTDQTHMLDGFWIEQGHRDGLLIYPQESPAFFDAYFFMGSEYIKFRYWKNESEYQEKYAVFQHIDGKSISVPKLITQYGSVYNCITSNGSKLKNYEKGSFVLEKNGDALSLTITPQGSGPGTHAAGDTYPHQRYPRIEKLPVAYDEKAGIFAFGSPFLLRSAVTDLQDEILKHNSLKRPPPEPLIKADELDFYWERIKEIRKER